MTYADHGGRAIKNLSLQLFDSCDRGFEFCRRHGYSSLAFFVCCIGSGLFNNLTTRSEESCWVCVLSVCDQETSTMGRCMLNFGCCATEKKRIVTYRAESWTLMNKMKRTLVARERKILRRTYGGAYENSSWRIKMNKDICNKFKSSGIVTVIKVRILEWLGHMVRINSARTVKKLLEGKSAGRRRKGRPRLRWMDYVNLNLRNSGVTRWTKRASNRTEWVSLERKAKAKVEEMYR